MENNKQYLLANEGMNRDKHPSMLTNNEYTFALNSNIENENGEQSLLQTEPSNILCSKFTDGFKVIKHATNINTGKTYFFLVNPETNTSEIGVINNIHNISLVEDTESECNCSYKSILAEPLENQVQIETCVYTTLLNDNCNKCLNFDVRFPIKSVVFHENLMFFTDFNNSTRFLDLDNIESYKYFKDETCDDAEILNCEQDTRCSECENCNTCPNCDKMLLFKGYLAPCLESVKLTNGGNLKMGTYQFFKAACDSQGNELSEYFTVTGNIAVFDQTNNTLDQTLLAKETNYAIVVETAENDLKYEYYKIAVAQITSVDGVVRYFNVGVFPTNTKSFTYSSENNKTEISLQEILRTNTIWNKSKGLVVNEGKLFHLGLETKEEINLQPIINLMSPFVKWATGVASEDLYKDGANEHLYGSALRNENYPLAIKFHLTDGRVLAPNILTHRPPINGTGSFADDEEFIVVDGTPTVPETASDLNSVLDNTPDCGVTRNKKWQFYNTATKDSVIPCAEFDPETGIEFEEESTTNCVTEAVAEITTGSLELTSEDEFTNLLDFINSNKDEFCSGGKYSTLPGASTICSILTGDYSLDRCTPSVPPSCTLGAVIDDVVYASSVNNLVKEVQAKDLVDYIPTDSPAVCGMYKVGNYDGKVLDTQFQTDTGVSANVFIRNDQSSIELCSGAATINAIPSQGYFLDYEFNSTLVNLTQPSITTGGAFAGFTSNLHKRAIWFKFDFNGRSKALVEVTPQTACSGSELFTGNSIMRMSTFDSCGSTTNVDVAFIDLSNGYIMELDRADYSSDNILIAFDSPIVTVGPSIHYLNPPCGCFSILDREYENSGTLLTWDSLVFSQKTNYVINCTYIIPQPGECEVLPFSEGKFGYFESIRTYPDNGELFDSSNLVIPEAGIPTEIKTEFESYFTTGTSTGNYILNSNTNLRCKPVRLYRMPGNDIAPFMINSPLPGFQKSIIFPLGIKISNSVINYFLDLAVANNLISQEDRNLIFKYEILRGDRTLDKSIIAKGILFDSYKYTDSNGKSINYPNYPYNGLGADTFHYEDRDSNTLLTHPESNNRNNRFTFHSPDTHFNSPNPVLPNEMEYEGYMYGRSRGAFHEVEDHPKYVILGKSAYVTATTLGALEATLETVTVIGKSYLEYISNLYVEPVTGGFNPLGLTGSPYWLAIVAAQSAVNLTISVGRYRYQWLKIFRDNGKPRNFAYKYGSYGFYNHMKYDHTFGNKLRGLASAVYLKGGGRYTISEKETGDTININNEDRESSVFLSLGSHHLNYSTAYKNYDNYDTNQGQSSRRTSEEAGAINNGDEFDSNIASPYVSLKQFVPDQYGDIHSIRWIGTNNCGLLAEDNACKIIYGFDVKISRMSLKRKMPFFLVNAIGQANFTPFAYTQYNNIADVNYYANFDIELSETVGATLAKAIFPDTGSEYKFDADTGGFYKKPPSKMYLFSFGIPQFLVESEINTNYRYARRNPESWFFPNGNASDYNWWTQEKYVPIRYDNEFNFNNTYRRIPILEKRQLLPIEYSKAAWERKSKFHNGVIASQPDVTEYNLVNPWLTYKPADVYEFVNSPGKLIDIISIESGQLLAIFTNQYMLLNTIDTLRERLSTTNKTLGTGIFGQRPIESNKTKLGYAGSQHMVSENCEFGHFFIDARRAQIMMIGPGGNGATDIASYKRNGKPSGMRNWFKEHLPFKILRGGIQGLTDLDLDNAYNSVGITMGWDNRYRRLFITKKDYIVKEEYVGSLKFIDNQITIREGFLDIPVSVTDTKYFSDASFTISYSVIEDRWISFHSFKPNYYISHLNYFQTGLNNSSDSNENGLWSHLLTNRSFLVYYGKRYPWTIELPSVNKLVNNIFVGSELWLDVKRYHNEYDFSENRNIGFNKAWVYNNSDNTGLLNLVKTAENDARQLTLYPKNEGDSTSILVTQFDKRWTFNDCFNKVRDEYNNIPHWINDVNVIDKYINLKAMNFVKPWNDRLRGDWFLTRLSQDFESRYRMIFKFGFNIENSYAF